MPKPILKIKVHSNENAIPDNVIRINDEASEILKRLQRETGWSIKTLASKLITFAAPLVDVEEE